MTCNVSSSSVASVLIACSSLPRKREINTEMPVPGQGMNLIIVALGRGQWEGKAKPDLNFEAVKQVSPIAALRSIPTEQPLFEGGRRIQSFASSSALSGAGESGG
ncbi:hypothetical protein BLNAU_9244 [Blattamonas nauphoetae]|uniref:Uncharacterized protein n=1 Tax=Blattamonas nauphoetae TaxID=2049346 RepID=A0ABQ9XWN8_9EUKA|nr:hypothetical protein BLNAU_9244 [Blattamonas nauphoetae]